MRTFFRNIIKHILMWESRAVLRKYKPEVIAVAGDVGKTSTKEAVYHAIAPHARTHRSPKSFNSELGLPLTILDCPNGWRNPRIWLRNIFKGLRLALVRQVYPEALVLELGDRKPGDMKYLARIVKPRTIVVTEMSEVPVHIEFFATRDQFHQEKYDLVNTLPDDGTLVVNYDNQFTRALPDKLGRIALSYGFDEGADIRARSAKVVYSRDSKLPVGYSAQIIVDEQKHNLTLSGIIGKAHVYSMLAAIAVAHSRNYSIKDTITALEESYTPPRGRQRLVSGVKGTVIIDDTYNSSPVAAELALDTLASIKTKGRRIAILADMTELGDHTETAHNQIGKRAAKVCDILITVGPLARTIATAATSAGMPAKKVFVFRHAREAGKFVEQICDRGDCVLIKGSQSTRMERAVQEIMMHPEEREKLLVRQEPQWLKKK